MHKCNFTDHQKRFSLTLNSVQEEIGQLSNKNWETPKSCQVSDNNGRGRR